MKKFAKYQKRPIRFLGVEKSADWNIKMYSISSRQELIEKKHINAVDSHLPQWLENSTLTDKPNYKVAVLILHEGADKLYAVLSWWVDENVLQVFTYSSEYESPTIFEQISNKGIVACVWEMAVLCFERKAWIQEMMQDANYSDGIKKYLQQQFNDDI